MTPPVPDKKSNTSLLQYASMGTQLLVGLGVSVFIGLKADNWLTLKIPVLVWVFPLIILIVFIIKLVRDTAQKK